MKGIEDGLIAEFSMHYTGRSYSGSTSDFDSDSVSSTLTLPATACRKRGTGKHPLAEMGMIVEHSVLKLNANQACEGE